mmetsp:Transcript_36748/g.80061  ORF Transcript_36748/g.80061 Transcript_36748/m.80061 type:complete len:315 (-) Transcript_36748:144-1088(-)
MAALIIIPIVYWLWPKKEEVTEIRDNVISLEHSAGCTCCRCHGRPRPALKRAAVPPSHVAQPVKSAVSVQTASPIEPRPSTTATLDPEESNSSFKTAVLAPAASSDDLPPTDTDLSDANPDASEEASEAVEEAPSPPLTPASTGLFEQLKRSSSKNVLGLIRPDDEGDIGREISFTIDIEPEPFRPFTAESIRAPAANGSQPSPAVPSPSSISTAPPPPTPNGTTTTTPPSKLHNSSEPSPFVLFNPPVTPQSDGHSNGHSNPPAAPSPHIPPHLALAPRIPGAYDFIVHPPRAKPIKIHRMPETPPPFPLTTP